MIKTRSWSFRLFIVGFFLYLASFGNQFLFDDHFYFVNNVYIGDIGMIPKLFTTNNTEGAGLLDNYYRPLSALTLSLDKMLWGTSPLGYHLTNTWMHALAGVVLFWLLREIKFGQWSAIWVVLIFLVHPLQVQAVAYMASRGDPQYALLLLISLWLWAKITSRKTWQWKVGKWPVYLTCLATYLGAILSKEIAIAGIGLFVLIWWIQMGWIIKPKKLITALRESRSYVLMLVGVMLILSLYLTLRFTVFNFVGFQSGFYFPEEYKSSLFVRVMTFGKVFWRYLGMFFWPHPLYFERTTEVFRNINIWFVSFGAMIGLSFWAGWIELIKKKTAWVMVGFLWFLGMLVPISGILPVNGYLYENWLYVPLIGLSIICIKLFEYFSHSKIKHNLILYSVCGVLALLTFRQIGFWKDEITFYEYNLQFNPSARIELNLGNAYANQKNYDKALELFESALSRDSQMVQAHLSKGKIYEIRGDYSAAETEMSTALEKRPDYFPGRKELIRFYVDQKKYDLAFEHAQLLAEQTPEDWTVYVMLGRIEFIRGNNQAASMHFDTALDITDNHEKVIQTINQIKLTK